MQPGSDEVPLVEGEPVPKSQLLANWQMKIAAGSCCCCCFTILLPLIIFVSCASITISSQVTAEVVDELLGGRFRLFASDMPHQQHPSVLEAAVEQLDGDVWDGVEEAAGSLLTWGSADAATVAALMYNVTKVNVVWERVPQKLRGVFWMKGNGVPEELTVLQYGLWSETSLAYLVPAAPFMWSWPKWKPAKAPFSGSLYTPYFTYFSAVQLTQNKTFWGDYPPPTFSYVWDSPSLTNAQLQVHPGDDLAKDMINLNAMSAGYGPSWATGDFKLIEEIPDGVQWKRDIKWGVGGCRCIDFGAYTLVKVIDGNGAPVQPNYDEFIDYMGDVPLIVWTGYV